MLQHMVPQISFSCCIPLSFICPTDCYSALNMTPLLLLLLLLRQIEEMVEVPVVLELASDLLDRRCPIFRWGCRAGRSVQDQGVP